MPEHSARHVNGSVEQRRKRDRALRKAYHRLANRYPKEWTLLVSEAYAEEGLTVDGRLTT